MKSRKMKTTPAFSGVLALLLLAVGLAAMPPAALAAKDTLTVTAMTSSSGFAPSSTGAPPEWFYVFCVPSGGSLHESFVVHFDLSGNNIGGSATISFNAAGSPAIRGTGDANLSGLSSFGLAENSNTDTPISIDTGTLADGVYHLNIQIKAEPSNKIALSHKTIHIMVRVEESCATPLTRCFLTDSNFLLLNDCSGNEVSRSSGGTFAIVPNARGIVVATNPGQFYYNLLWTNTGATQDVTINLAASNLVPQGANAVHALVSGTSGFVADKDAWDMVNQDGTPCGPIGPCTISVEAGTTVWVTWHVAYAKIGSRVSLLNLGTGCSEALRNDDGTISATGMLTDSSNATLATCIALAQGYLKR